jgi:two-component system sensor histidine kinase DegS
MQVEASETVMISRETDAAKSSKDETLDILRAELQRLNAELFDIGNKIDQSRGQLEGLSQRNAVVVGEIRKIETALEQTPRSTIKETYSEALNTQQRLMVTRGQMEKLQAQEVILREGIEAVKSAIDTLSKEPHGEGGAGGTMNTREMIIRVIDAQEKERDQLARRMHDGPAHALTNFILQAEICQKLFEKNPEKAREELSSLMVSARDSFQNVRGFIFDLRPMMLTDLGLVPTIKRYLEAVKDKSGIETEFIMSGRERRLESYVEVLIFRGIQELLNNARDQLGATSVKVTLEMGNDRVRALVEDNGRGFGSSQLSLDESTSKSLGLSALQERVHLVGGTLLVDSVAGQGSRIEIDMPAGPDVPDDGGPGPVS